MPKLSNCSEILYVLGIAMFTTSTADKHEHWPTCLNDPLFPPLQLPITALPAASLGTNGPFPFEEDPGRQKRDASGSSFRLEQENYAQLLSVDILRYLGLQLITFYTSDVTGAENDGVSFSFFIVILLFH